MKVAPLLALIARPVPKEETIFTMYIRFPRWQDEDGIVLLLFFFGVIVLQFSLLRGSDILTGADNIVK